MTSGRFCVYLRQVIEFYYSYGLMRVKPYNPVKPVNGVKIVIHLPILERDAPIVKDDYGRVSKLSKGDAFRVDDKYYVVVGNDYFERIKKEREKEESRQKQPLHTPYKDFYINKMRQKR